MAETLYLLRKALAKLGTPVQHALFEHIVRYLRLFYSLEDIITYGFEICEQQRSSIEMKEIPVLKECVSSGDEPHQGAAKGTG